MSITVCVAAFSIRARSHGVSDFGFGIMMVNPFSPHGSRTVTKDLSALAPTSNTAVMQNYRQVLMLNFNVNLDFGSRASTRGYQRINNEDKENGILSGTK